MRVISGSAKGLKLLPIKGDEIRPTTDRIKEAVFSILYDKVIMANVLDLFSGTGALGIEALSRGAARCVFIDNKRSSLDVTKKNLEKTGLLEKSEIICMDSLSYLEQTHDKFDIILIDPPYDRNFIQKCLSIIDVNDIITKKGVIVCESSREDILKDDYNCIHIRKEYLYGGSKITVYNTR